MYVTDCYRRGCTHNHLNSTKLLLEKSIDIFYEMFGPISTKPSLEFWGEDH